MSEPSKKPLRKSPKPDPNLPDDEAIRKLFPKRLVERVNREIEHEPKPPKPTENPKDS
jgi:hypothetical protein